MDRPVIVALAESLRGPEAERVAAVSPRVRIAYVSTSGEPRDDVSDAEVVYRGFGLMPPGLRRLLPLMPKLRWIHVMGAGVDGDLTPQVVASDIVVTRTRGLHNLPVSEWVMLQLLAVTKRLPELVLAQHEHQWHPVEVPVTIQGRTMGIVGYGEIGQTLAVRARAFGLRVVGTRRHPQPAAELDAVYPPSELERLLEQSDYVVILTPLTSETRGLIGEAQLRRMKPDAWLINVARGEVIQEEPLLRALRENWIAGAALDVFPHEPLPADSPLWQLPNVLITPHNGGVRHPNFSAEALNQFLDNLGRYVRGEPLRNQVDKGAGY
ncbi:MAG TPA: D-2-hydroxyacid dehydrogenase [Chloroflexota bacterium]|nr:D-2-hydroxyacid dehydrogenase [Chloroflexota bacterium]